MTNGKNIKVTSRVVAGKAGKILRNPNSSKTEKSQAGSALGQRGRYAQTSPSIARKDSKTLSGEYSTKSQKSIAASGLSQSSGKKKS